MQLVFIDVCDLGEIVTPFLQFNTYVVLPDIAHHLRQAQHVLILAIKPYINQLCTNEIHKHQKWVDMEELQEDLSAYASEASTSKNEAILAETIASFDITINRKLLMKWVPMSWHRLTQSCWKQLVSFSNHVDEEMKARKKFSINLQ